VTFSEETRRSAYKFQPKTAGTFVSPPWITGAVAQVDQLGLRLSSTLPWERDISMRLRLLSYGREGLEHLVAPRRGEAETERVAVRHPQLTEWYRFDERGIEQGFTLDAPAPSGPAGAPVLLELSVSGPLAAQGQTDADSIRFVGKEGREAISYSALKVFDASGAELRAALRLLPGIIQIRIQDDGALYPLTIDPLLSTPSWTSSFGAKVAGAGDVNGDGYADVVVASFGTAYLYEGSANGLSKNPSWTSPQGGMVAGAGDVNGDGYDDVVICGPYIGDRPTLYEGSPIGLSTDPAWSPDPTPDQPEVRSMASAGDVNGDGYADIVVGSANGFTNPAVRVYLGGANGPDTAPAWTIGQPDPYTALGYSVSSAGDVNGDGFGDVIVGEPLYGVTEPFEAPATGRARVYLGSAAGPEANPAWVTARLVEFGWLGSSVSSAGDLDGDGHADVAVGAVNGFRGTEPGVVQVYLGSAAGPATSTALDYVGDGFLTHLGTAVAAAGDVNGDGYADLIVGEPDFDLTPTQESYGRAYLFMGQAGGVSATPVWHAQGESAFQGLGISVSSAGDVNGDGFDDVLVGSFSGASVYMGGAANHPPVAHALALAAVECTSAQGADVLLDGSDSEDPDSSAGTRDDIQSYEWLENFGQAGEVLIATGVTACPTLALGSHLITLRVTDRSGSSATANTEITVTDSRPPSLTVSLSRDLLWPPTHRMVDIHAAVRAQDACGAAQVVLTSITSSEADDAPGGEDGDTTGDIQGATTGSADFDFQVRAERSEDGDGRTYTVSYLATDRAGNSVSVTRDIQVPIHQPRAHHVKDLRTGGGRR